MSSRYISNSLYGVPYSHHEDVISCVVDGSDPSFSIKCRDFDKLRIIGSLRSSFYPAVCCLYVYLFNKLIRQTECGLTGSVPELGEIFFCTDVFQLFHYQDKQWMYLYT